MNCEIHNKELLAVVDRFLRWRQYLDGATHRIDVYSDHQNLAYFTTAKILNRRQACWAQQLTTFNFIIHYRPGSQNSKADTLSRLEQHRPEKGGPEDQPIRSVLQAKHFISSTFQICAGYSPFISQALQHSRPFVALFIHFKY